MLRNTKRLVRNLANRLGYDVVPVRHTSRIAGEFPADFDPETIETCRIVKPYTMTSYERICSLCNSVRYVVEHNLPGDIVECGVWKGGSMMAIARTLQSLKATRKLHLFDTFEGMSAPTDVDVSFRGETAADVLAKDDKNSSTNWGYCSLDEVRRNLMQTGYDPNQILYVKGKVEDTIPTHAPSQIAILRLDTDWYESTYHELVHLYPRLCVGGVLIIDDYGHWQGAKKAVDQYFAENRLKLLLNRIDYTGRIAIKIE